MNKDGIGSDGRQRKEGSPSQNMETGWPTIAKDPGMGKSGQHVKRMAKDSQRG